MFTCRERLSACSRSSATCACAASRAFRCCARSALSAACSAQSTSSRLDYQTHPGVPSKPCSTTSKCAGYSACCPEHQQSARHPLSQFGKCWERRLTGVRHSYNSKASHACARDTRSQVRLTRAAARSSSAACRRAASRARSSARSSSARSVPSRSPSAAPAASARASASAAASPRPRAASAAASAAACAASALCWSACWACHTVEGPAPWPLAAL